MGISLDHIFTLGKPDISLNRTYAVLVGIQFRKGITGCGRKRKKPTANLRELTQIAFFLRRCALLRLIAYAGIAHRLEKCYRKNRRAGFSFKLALFLCCMRNNKRTEKPARRFFQQHFSREGAILRRRSAGAEHPKARKMRFALIRGDSRVVFSDIRK